MMKTKQHGWKRWTAALTSCMMLAVSCPTSMLTQTASAADSDANFAKALQYSTKCRTPVSETPRFRWRGDCHT